MTSDQSRALSTDGASSPFIWPPVIGLVAVLSAGFLAWAVPWSFLPLGFLGFIVRLVGLAAIVGGLMLMFGAERLFKRAGTPVPPTQPTTTIVTDGVYARTRNPMYLGGSTIIAGLGFLTGSIWFLLALPLVMFALTKLAIEREEAYLDAKFGEAYRDYRARVRRWL